MVQKTQGVLEARRAVVARGIKRGRAQAASSWGYATTMLPDGTYLGIADWKGRATPAERKLENYVSLREMRSIQERLENLGMYDLVTDPNGVVLSGVVESKAPKGTPRRHSLATLRFVGPEQQAMVKTAGVSWLKFTKKFKGFIVDRELSKENAEFIEENPRRLATFAKWCDR